MRKASVILASVPRHLVGRAGVAALAALVLAAVPASADAPGPDATRLIPVGPGPVENTIHQVVRTDDGRVYIATADDDALGGGPGFTAHLRMYRGDQIGSPTSFSEMDAADAPSFSRDDPFRNTISGGDSALTADGIIHLSYFRTDIGAAVHQTFSTVTDTWGPADTVMLAGTQDDDFFGSRGRQLTASALGPGDVPFVALSGGTGSAAVRVWHPGLAGLPVIDTIEDADSDRQRWHPSMAFDRQGRLHLAWLDSPSASGTPDRIQYAVRSAAGDWSTPVDVASGDVLGANIGGVVDQGPSLGVDRLDRPVVLYLDAEDHVRVRVLDTDGTWLIRDPPGDVFSHGPGLAMRGDDMTALLGHDVNVHPAYLYRPGASGAWSDTTVLDPPAGVTSWSYDGSGAARSDVNRDPACQLLDAVFFDEDSDSRDNGAFEPDLYYAAITLPAVNGVCGTEPADPGCSTACAPPATGGSGGSGPTTRAVRPDDHTAPRLTRMTLTRTRFRAGDSRARAGFTLSEPATVTLAIQRRIGSGRRARWVASRSYAVSRHAGHATALLRSRSGSVRLRSGIYRVQLRARDAAGNRSGLVSRGFAIRR
jgi:hypothetical protein